MHDLPVLLLAGAAREGVHVADDDEVEVVVDVRHEGFAVVGGAVLELEDGSHFGGGGVGGGGRGHWGVGFVSFRF